MADKNKTQPKAFRITEETAEKFKEIAQSLGVNQQQALAKLIEVYEMEVGKESIPEMRGNIDTFEEYIHAATNMYMQALETNQNMRALIRTEYEAQLKSKDKVIEDLQKKMETVEEVAKQIDKKEKEYLNRIHTLENDKKILEKKVEEVYRETKNKIEMYDSRYNELKASFEKLQMSEENFKSIVTSFMKECEKLKEENKELLEHKTLLEENNLELTQINHRLSIELEDEKKKVIEEEKRATIELEHYKEKSEIQHLLELQKKENELKDCYDKKVEELRKELEYYQKMYYETISTKALKSTEEE